MNSWPFRTRGPTAARPGAPSSSANSRSNVPGCSSESGLRKNTYSPRTKGISIRMRDRVQPTIVVFGEPGSEPILGVLTLEEFRVAADPVNRRLVSIPGRLH